MFEVLRSSRRRIAELVLPMISGKTDPANGAQPRRIFELATREPRDKADGLPDRELLGEAEGVPADPVPGTAEILAELRGLPAERVVVRHESRVVLQSDPESPGADRFRFLRMRLRELGATGKLRSLLITSPRPADGKSTIALNLATALAERGRRTVLLVEADYYHPTLARTLGLRPGAGLAECLEDNLNPVTALRRVEPLGWYFLPAGKPRGNPTELLHFYSLSSVLTRLAPLFDWILIDTPPVAPVADAVSLSQYADASLLVVRADETPRVAIEEALALLGPKHVLGIILNGAEGLNRMYSKYYGYYGKKRQEPDDATPCESAT